MAEYVSRGKTSDLKSCASGIIKRAILVLRLQPGEKTDRIGAGNRSSNEEIYGRLE